MYEHRINDLFESWLVEKNFSAGQIRILRLIKSQYVARKEPIDVSIFNEPIFQQLGGLNYALQIFADDQLQDSLTELNQRVFAQSNHA